MIAFDLAGIQHVARFRQSFGIPHPHRSSINNFVQQVAQRCWELMIFVFQPNVTSMVD
ncbi:hypothetical protein FQZ97_654990 [compost metagenome]